jgi:cardiolipin synthase
LAAKIRPEERPMIIKDWKKDILTIPNLLSLFRLVLIPVYVLMYLNASEPEHYYIAGGILAVSCLTDMIDGMIARHFNMISTFGKFLDPLADKATQFTLAICLAITYPIVWIMVALIFVKEIFQLIAGIVAFRHGLMLKGALISGKICTTILFISLIFMVISSAVGLSSTTVYIITIIDVVFLLIAFIDYARTYYKHTPMLQEMDDQE